MVVLFSIGEKNKMTKLFYVFMFALSLCACVKKELKPVVVQTQTGDVTYYVEVADTADKMMKGLMFRKTLRRDSGMIFLFDQNHPQPVAMWMKNTFISLDMLFVSEKGEIVGLAENTEPLSLKTISPTKKHVAAVIELNAGEVQRNGIKIGDNIRF